MKILSKFSRKFREKFRKLWKYAFIGVRGGAEPPEASEIIKNLVEKAMAICKPLKGFINYNRIFPEKAKF